MNAMRYLTTPAAMAHGGALWHCSPASDRLRQREREWSGAKGSRRCGEQDALATEKKEGREGGIGADRELAGAPAMAWRRNLAQYLDAGGREGAHGVELVEAELGASLIGRGWSGQLALVHRQWRTAERHGGCCCCCASEWGRRERVRDRMEGGLGERGGVPTKVWSERPWPPVAGVRLPRGGCRRGRGGRVHAWGGGGELGRAGEWAEREAVGPAARAPFPFFLNFFFPNYFPSIF